MQERMAMVQPQMRALQEKQKQAKTPEEQAAIGQEMMAFTGITIFQWLVDRVLAAFNPTSNLYRAVQRHSLLTGVVSRHLYGDSLENPASY